MDDAQQDAPSIRRTEQIDRLQRSMRDAIIDVAIDQLQSDNTRSTPIWWPTSAERASDGPKPTR